MAGGLFNLGMQSVKTFGAKNTLKGASAANKAINAGNKLGHVGVGTATGAVAGAAGDKEDRLGGAIKGGLIGAAGGSLAKGMAAKSNAISQAKGFGQGALAGAAGTKILGSTAAGKAATSSVKGAVQKGKSIFDKGMETVRKNVGEEGFSKIKNAGAEAVKKTEDAAKNLMGDDWVKMTKDRAKDVIK